MLRKSRVNELISLLDKKKKGKLETRKKIHVNLHYCFFDLVKKKPVKFHIKNTYINL